MLRRPLLAAFLAAACAHTPPARAPEPRRFEFVDFRMGTSIRVVLYAPDEAAAESAGRAALAAVAAVDDAMSDWRSDSELSRLNAAAGGAPVPVSAELFEVLEAAARIAAASGGAFDPTVGPVVRLWRRAREEARLPDEAALREARALVGFGGLELDRARGTARLARAGMALDLGGIAKGHASDRALAVLRAHGTPRALVGCAGDLALGEPPPGEAGWRVRVGEEGPVLVVARCGISTSGDDERHFEIGGRRYSHIVDPRTGLGLTGGATVTVTAPDARTADALATAVSVLGPDQGRRLAEAFGATAHVWPRKGVRPLFRLSPPAQAARSGCSAAAPRRSACDRSPPPGCPAPGAATRASR